MQLWGSQNTIILDIEFALCFWYTLIRWEMIMCRMEK